MMMLPFHILGIWLRGLVAVAILAFGVYAVREWVRQSTPPPAGPPVVVRDPADPDRPAPAPPGRPVSEPPRFEPNLGWNRPTAWLAGGVALLTLASLGRILGTGVARLVGSAGSNAASGRDDEPRDERTGEPHRLRRPDGTDIQVECYGPVDGPPIVLVHGWAATSAAWFYQKKALTDRYRLIVWDEPGLGLSTQPSNRDYSLEKMAADLEAVLQFAGGRPAVLVGHSIGGMILLTHAREFAGSLGTRVAGLMLVHTTPTNPVRTTSWATLTTALEKPLIIPLLHLTIAAWPLAWVLNWLTYANGSIHRSTRKGSFAGTQSEGQVDFVARTLPRCRPDVIARGMLGMIRYDATRSMSAINVPTLVVIGDRDTTTLPEAGRRIAEAVPGATLTTLTPARHMGLLEHHAAFNREIARFVDSCQPAAIP